MGYIVVATLVVLGLLIILFGDKNVGKNGGVTSRTFSVPSLQVTS